MIIMIVLRAVASVLSGEKSEPRGGRPNIDEAQVLGIRSNVGEPCERALQAGFVDRKHCW